MDARTANTKRAESLPLRCIVSGGQTGVDRAALDVALELGLPHGGWCPQGRRAEDGPLPDRYQLQETPQWSYRFRTERNVLDSDGTLILYVAALQGGTELTWRLCRRHQKPVCMVDLDQTLFPGWVTTWLEENEIQRLNVAGPRESTQPGIYRRAKRFLEELLRGES